MKIVKKVFISLAVLVMLIASAIILPFFFKGKIKSKIDEEIAKNVNADVIFDVNNFSLSVFRHFPDITAEIKEVGVFNRAPFKGIHLIVVERVDVEVNLKNVLFGEQLHVKGITLVRPQINVRVLKDGRANYNIIYPSKDSVKSTGPRKFSFAIDNWSVEDGELGYDDESLGFFMALKGLNHDGRGNFNEEQFDLSTKTEADSVTVRYGGIEYITNKHVSLAAIIAVSESYSKYVFKENSARINDFVLGFDGWFKMNEKDFGMEINFKSPENTFKSLLSLVPGMYSKDFSRVETKGDLSFSGFVKGTYSAKLMPSFNVDLKVKDALFKYPSLPTAVSNINMDLMIGNKTGVIENTRIDLKNLRLDFGKNPIEARATIENLKDYPLNADIKASLNLAELNKMFPMEGLEMKGTFKAAGTANGVYNSTKKIIPSMNIEMSLSDGYVKSSKFPLPLEDLKFNSTVKNMSGKMAETMISVNGFSMLMDEEKFKADLTLQNLEDYTWSLKADGGIDLEKMTKIFPLVGMTMAGKVSANIETKGRYSDVTAKHYDRLPTSGSASLTNFRFASKALPYSIAIAQANATFTPQRIEIQNMIGAIGKSDFKINGFVGNYIGYVFGKETISGNMNFDSKLLDLNEFMSDATPASKEDTTKMTVIPIPSNVEFVLHSEVGTVQLMDYMITQASGNVIIKNSIADLSNMKFDMLGGSFVVNGAYNTANLSHPRFDFDLRIDNLSIQQASNSFSIVKAYAPIAGMATGKFGTDFKISGELGQDMMPKLNTVNGNGIVRIADAAVTQSKLISGITSLTNLSNIDQITLKNVTMSTTITDGKLSVKPFNVKFGDYATAVSGSTALNGVIDYSMKMTVPAGKLGTQFQGLVNQYAGTNNPTSEIPLNINLGGTYANPKATLITQGQRTQMQQAVTDAGKQKGSEVLQQAVSGTKPQDIVNNVLAGKKDTTKKQRPETKPENILNAIMLPKKDTTNSNARADSAKAAQEYLQDKLQGLFKKKKKN